MLRRARLLAATALCAAFAPGCDEETTVIPTTNNQTTSDFYDQTPLVSDKKGTAEHVDSNLVNPWGLAFGPNTFFWIANNGTDTSTLYDGNGVSQSAVIGGPVTIPSAVPPVGGWGGSGEPSTASPATPTGIVFSGGDGFRVSASGKTGASRFIFATQQGTILGWAPDVDQRTAEIAVQQPAGTAVYTGLAIGKSSSRTLIYAANLANKKVDVFDESFQPATGLAKNAFIDPKLPSSFSPFNVQEIGGRIYVAFTKRSADAPEEEPGPGNGQVSVFDTNGAFMDRVASGGVLNAPWGLARAPDTFGKFAGALLVGNFGDGRITAIDTDTHKVLGQLESSKGHPIVTPGLWALSFGNGNMAGDPDVLYFTAGIDDETHGLFGEIAVH